MELEKKYIYQVYQCGSFSKAAEALFITQPALSIAIKKVEQEIGAAIFNRSQRPLTLTSIGELYLQHIKKEMLRHTSPNSTPSIPTSTLPWQKQALICSLKCSKITSLISPSAVMKT